MTINNKQAIIYTRFSPRPNAKECDSCVRQDERCSDYCDKKEYVIIATFYDKNVSGKSLNRPELDKAIGLLKPGMILVVDRQDRLARDMLVALTIYQQVESKGCTIEFADGSPVRNTPEGKLFQNILAAFANFELEKFAERTKIGMARKKANGVWCGRPPYGYRKPAGSDKLVYDIEEQDMIGKALECSALGMKSEKIAEHLNSFDCPCRGKPWTGRSVRSILARQKISLDIPTEGQ